MALDPQSVLAKLNATTPEQITALRYLKNEVIGHIHKKEDWVRHGVLRPIVRVITPSTLKANEDTRPPFLTLTAFTDEDSAKLQALQLLASFANGMSSQSDYSHLFVQVLSLHFLSYSWTSLSLAATRSRCATSCLKQFLSPKWTSPDCPSCSSSRARHSSSSSICSVDLPDYLYVPCRNIIRRWPSRFSIPYTLTEDPNLR